MTVEKVPVGGGANVIVASGQNSPYWITTDSNNIYWTEFTSSGDIMKIAK